MVFIDINCSRKKLMPNKFNGYNLFTIETDNIDWITIENLIKEFLIHFNYNDLKINKIEVWEEEYENPTRVYMPEDIEKLGDLNKCKSIW